MKAKLARWRESFIFNKFRLTKNLLSCPHFLCHHGLVWQSSIREQSIQIILASLTLQRRKWGSPTRKSESCVPKGTRDWSTALSTSEYHPSHPSRFLHANSWPGHSDIQSEYLELIPDVGHLHILLSLHALLTISKLFSKFSLAQDQSSSGTYFPDLMCCFTLLLTILC